MDVLTDYPLQENRFACFWVIEQSLAETANNLNVELLRIAPHRFVRSYETLDFGMLFALEPLRGGAHLFRIMAFSNGISSKVSIVMTNLADGWSSLASNIARLHQKTQVFFRSTAKNTLYPMHGFEVWKAGLSIRKVMAYRDSDRWVFWECGETQLFEDESFYQKRFIRHRLNRPILLQYATSFGLDVSNSAFWQSESPAVYFSETRKR